MKQSSDRVGYLLGLDGGGTTTKVCITDLQGRPLARLKADGININGQSTASFDRAMQGILGSIRQAGYDPADCAGIGIGTAGLKNPIQKALLSDGFSAGGYTAPLFTYGDDDTALATAFADCHGIILIAGTGSVCLGMRGTGQKIRSGGFGYLIDDGGSAYALASDILTAVVRGEDGRGKPTVLRDMVLDALHIDSPDGITGFLYAPGRSKREIATLAVLLSPAVEAGDAAALAIEEKAVGELFLMVQAVASRMPEERGLAFTGSVLQKNVRIRDRLADRILHHIPGMHIEPPVEDASVGAIRLLLRDLGARAAGV